MNLPSDLLVSSLCFHKRSLYRYDKRPAHNKNSPKETTAALAASAAAADDALAEEEDVFAEVVGAPLSFPRACQDCQTGLYMCYTPYSGCHSRGESDWLRLHGPYRLSSIESCFGLQNNV